jgi:hypothetical protein
MAHVEARRHDAEQEMCSQLIAEKLVDSRRPTSWVGSGGGGSPTAMTDAVSRQPPIEWHDKVRLAVSKLVHIVSTVHPSSMVPRFHARWPDVCNLAVGRD